MPFQSNTYFSSGPLEKTGNVVIIQPIVPTKLTRDWNPSPDGLLEWSMFLGVLPITVQRSDRQPAAGVLFLTCAHRQVIWGVGPKLYLPTATSDELGINRIGGGLAAAALATNGPWIIGIIAHNVWAGSGHERVDQMTLSPLSTSTSRMGGNSSRAR